jgi:CDGSH iron-sulfur domain-containing protein 3
VSKPEIPFTSPAVVELEPGTYWWCACGRSKNQPWCDGSHSCTDFSPVKVVITEKKRYALCQCKHSERQVFCDGTHKTLASSDP